MTFARRVKFPALVYWLAHHSDHQIADIHRIQSLALTLTIGFSLSLFLAGLLSGFVPNETVARVLSLLRYLCFLVLFENYANTLLEVFFAKGRYEISARLGGLLLFVNAPLSWLLCHLYGVVAFVVADVTSCAVVIVYSVYFLKGREV
jgi:O-antigen/teichoic acid export membrane protein